MIRATRIAAAARAAARSSGPGRARSGDSLASIGRPGFIAGLFRRQYSPSDPVEVRRVGAAGPGMDPGLVPVRAAMARAGEAEWLSSVGPPRGTDCETSVFGGASAGCFSDVEGTLRRWRSQSWPAP